MNLLRNSIVLRWAIAWVFISGVLALATSLLVAYTGKESILGNNFLSQYLAVLIFAAPWFLWGEILSRFVRKQKEYSSVRRIISVLGLLLMLLAIIYATGLVMMDW